MIFRRFFHIVTLFIFNGFMMVVFETDGNGHSCDLFHSLYKGTVNNFIHQWIVALLDWVVIIDRCVIGSEDSQWMLTMDRTYEHKSQFP